MVRYQTENYKVEVYFDCSTDIVDRKLQVSITLTDLKTGQEAIFIGTACRNKKDIPNRQYAKAIALMRAIKAINGCGHSELFIMELLTKTFEVHKRTAKIYKTLIDSNLVLKSSVIVSVFPAVN